MDTVAVLTPELEALEVAIRDMDELYRVTVKSDGIEEFCSNESSNEILESLGTNTENISPGSLDQDLFPISPRYFALLGWRGVGVDSSASPYWLLV